MQFANSPDLRRELINAIMGALDAHTTMSTQALNSKDVQDGIADVLMNHSNLYEGLRETVIGANSRKFRPWQSWWAIVICSSWYRMP